MRRIITQKNSTAQADNRLRRKLRAETAERRQAEEALRRSEEQFRRMVHEVKDYAIFMLDPQGRVLTWNEGAARIKGYDASEIIGKHFSCFYLPTEQAQGKPDHALKTAASEGRYEDEGWRLRKDGSRFLANTVITPLTGIEGQLVGFCKITQDITERRMVQAELASREAEIEASKLKAQFLATMSHEIRTPLHVILTYASLIERYLEQIGDRTLDSALAGIQRAGKRLKSTIDGILDISRIDAGSFEINPVPLDVPVVVGREVEEVSSRRPEKNLEIVWQTSQEHLLVLFDEYCLTQAIGQLLDNAIKFTNQGKIQIKLYRDSSEAAVLEISDTGIGIDEAYLSKLFQPFSQEESGYSRSYEGTGLGLALAKRYLQLNHAEVSAESRKSMGSTFRVRFSKESELAIPVADQTELRRAADHPDLSPHIPRKNKILVVEDDPDSQEVMRLLLSRTYDVLVAPATDEAQELISHQAQEIRVILLDLSLRGSMDGLSLAGAVRAHPDWQHIPIIAVTAHALPEDKERALQAGCSDYLPKPFSNEQLWAILRKWVRRGLMAKRAGGRR